MKTLKSMLRKKRDHALVLGALVVVTVFGMLAQTVQAQTTYVITDGDQVITHVTHTTDPAKVLTEAGLTLNEEDTFAAQATGEGRQIVVNRAMRVVVRLEGEPRELLSYGETVEELLNHNGIYVPEGCVLSYDRDAQVFDGMELRIDRVIRTTEQYTKEVPFQVVYEEDPSLPQGQEKILHKGENGQVMRTVSVTYRNAVEQQRMVTGETVLQEPVNQVVAVGTGAPEAPIIGDGKIILPNGDVLTYYKREKFLATAYTKTDAGCDDFTANGTPVHEGVVAVDPEVIPYGTRMFIVSTDGTYTYGLATAEDCGGAIIGNRLDLYMDTTEKCFQFGLKDCHVYFLGDANWRIY